MADASRRSLALVMAGRDPAVRRVDEERQAQGLLAPMLEAMAPPPTSGDMRDQMLQETRDGTVRSDRGEVASSYRPSTMRQRGRDLVALVGEALGFDERDAYDVARRVFGDPSASRVGRPGALDMTPLGSVMGVEEGRKQYRAGDRVGGAVNVGLGALDLAGTAGDVLPAMAAGVPLRGYHGSPNPSLETLRPSERGALGPGTYFSPDENVARRYAGNGGRLYQAELDDVFFGLGDKYAPEGRAARELWDEDTAKLKAAVEPENRAALDEALSGLMPGEGYLLLRRIERMYGDQSKAQELFRRAGFKGISGNADGPEIAMFDDVQIPRRGAERSLADRIADYRTRQAEAPQPELPPIAEAVRPGVNARRFDLGEFDGVNVKVYRNPSNDFRARLLRRSGLLRRIQDPDTGDVYVWDATDPAIHKQVADKLGFRYDNRVADYVDD